MTPEEVETWLGRIREHAANGDNEAAHAAEDDMRGFVLDAIANGAAAYPAYLARRALTSKDIKFERWDA